MALIKSDRVKETSTSTGATTFALAGAGTGYRTFSSVCAIGDTFYYAISNQSNGEWEAGLGTYSALNTLTRTAVHSSSNSGNLVTFTSGTKEVFLTLTARHLDRINDNGQSTAIGSKTSVVAVNDSATLPDLDLQFSELKTLTAKYGPTPSYSRASTGRYTNSSGVLTSAAVNEPRFDHVLENGVWVSKGLLIEEQRTNIWLQSNNLNTSPWLKFNQNSTENAATSPDGTSNASNVVPTNDNTAHYTYQFFTTGATSYSISFYAKKNGYDFVQLSTGITTDYVNFNLNTGAVGNKSGGIYSSAKIESVGNGWYRCSVTIAATSGNSDHGICTVNADTASRRPAFVGDGTSGILLYGFQMEAGSFATSLIPTTSASVTRSADVCQITGSAFTNLWNASEGTISLEQDFLSYSDPAADQRYFAIAGGSNNPGLTLHYDGGSSFYWERYFNSASNLTLPDVSTAYKVAIAFKTNDYATVLNGGTPITSSSPAFGTNFAKMDIGYQVGATARSSWVQRLRYFRSRLDNTQLVNLSGGINTLAFKPVTGSGSVTVANEYSGINISVPNPLPITNGGTGGTTAVSGAVNLIKSAPNDGAEYTLKSKQISGTPSFYWVDSTGYAPTLDLLFAADKSLTAYTGPTPSFSRASTGTLFNSSGVLTTAAINGPRFNHTYNGTSWVSRGLLVEEQRTNLVTNSADFTSAWVDSNVGRITSSGTAPDGTNTAVKMYPTSSTAMTRIYRGASYSCISVFAKAAEKSIVYFYDLTGVNVCWFDLANGAIGTNNTSLTASMINCSNGWFRCSLASSSSTFSFFQIGVSDANGSLSSTASGTNGILIWGAQGESGAFPTSYIPTTTASATRSADVCQITGTSFGSMWNQGEGTIAVNYDCPAIGAIVQYQANSAASNNINTAVSIGTTQYFQVFLPPEQAFINAGSIVANVQQGLSTAYKLNDFAASLNGGAVATDTAGTIPTPTKIIIGSDGSVYTNGHIARLRYYPVRLPNATLQVLST